MPKWWLVTWTTYATWLPGDPRGFRTWQKREYVPSPKRYDYQERHDLALSQSDSPVILSLEEQQLVLDTNVGEIALIPLNGKTALVERKSHAIQDQGRGIATGKRLH